MKRFFALFCALILAVFSLSSEEQGSRGIACLDGGPVPSLLPAANLPINIDFLKQLGAVQFRSSNAEFDAYYNLLWKAEQDYFQGMERARNFYGNTGSMFAKPAPLQLAAFEPQRYNWSAQPLQRTTSVMGLNGPVIVPVMPKWP